MLGAPVHHIHQRRRRQSWTRPSLRMIKRCWAALEAKELKGPSGFSLRRHGSFPSSTQFAYYYYYYYIEIVLHPVDIFTTEIEKKYIEYHVVILVAAGSFVDLQ